MHRSLAQAISLFEFGLAECNRAEDRQIIERYLAELAPILADAVLGNDVLSRIARAERLFGNSPPIDRKALEPAFAKWREFKDEYEEFAVRGMTVNERLNAFGLADSYDRAKAARDTDGLRMILERVYVDQPSIAKVLAGIGGDGGETGGSEDGENENGRD